MKLKDPIELGKMINATGNEEEIFKYIDKLHAKIREFETSVRNSIFNLEQPLKNYE